MWRIPARIASRKIALWLLPVAFSALAALLGYIGHALHQAGASSERDKQAAIQAEVLRAQSKADAKVYLSDLAQLEARHARELQLTQAVQRPPVAALDCPALGPEWMHDYTRAIEAAARAGNVPARPAGPGDSPGGLAGRGAD